MPSTPRRRRSLAAPLLVLIVGIGLTGLVAGRITDAEDEALRAELQADAAQMGLLIQSLANGFETDLTSTVGVAVATAGDESIYRARVGDTTGGERALVRLDPDPVIDVVVADDEAGSRAAFAELLSDPGVRRSLDELADAGEFGFVTLGEADQGRAILLAAGASDGSSRWVELRRFDLGPAGPAIVSLVDGIDHFGVYVSDGPDPATAVLASTEQLPLQGITAHTTTDLGGQTLFIEVRGDVAQVVAPWQLLAAGATISVLLAGLLFVSQRRRDRALDALDAARAATDARMQLETDLQRAQRMEAVGQLAGGVAHDFNNLLAAITSTVELIIDDVDDALMREDLEEIRHAARRGASLTRRLLSFSRRDVEAVELLDLNRVIRDVEPLLRRSVTEDVDLTVALADQALPVVADSGEIEQILLNLVVNARDATSSSAHRIDIRSSATDDTVVVRVTDNGTGMPAEVADRAFEPFFSTKPKADGTGLGLAIVYGVATRLGGDVAIESTVGRGTTVTVSLPRVPEPVAGGAPADQRTGRIGPRPIAGRECVLLVEDEAAVRRAARRLLERAGHEVIATGSGDEAVELVRSGLEPTVLLTDVILPGSLNGRDVADHVRALQPDIRVVFASGYPSEIVRPGELGHLDDRFVSKPFTTDTLLDAVADIAVAVP